MGKNWFSGGGSAYAQFRPQYPPELAQFLADISPSTALAVDVGCGTGQLTVQLAAHFDSVIGIDPSADQLENAVSAEGVKYVCGPAEQLDVPDDSADLIAAAQAAHWFDLPAFYSEVRRIAADGAIIALISYGVIDLGPEMQARFRRFYDDEVGPFWPPQRRLVDTGYADLDFPFEQRAHPAMRIRQDWTFDQLIGYIATWSATRHAQQHKQDVLTDFAADLEQLWPGGTRTVTFPINMLVGTVDK